jgi:hypothetical protein
MVIKYAILTIPKQTTTRGNDMTHTKRLPDISMLHTPGGEFFLKPRSAAAYDYLEGKFKSIDHDLSAGEAIQILKDARAAGFVVD